MYCTMLYALALCTYIKQCTAYNLTEQLVNMLSIGCSISVSANMHIVDWTIRQIR